MPAPLDLVALATTAAGDWFPEIESADWQATVDWEARRPQSVLTVLTLASGAHTRRIIAKAVFAGGAKAAVARPRLGLEEDLDSKHDLEWQALRRAWAAMGAGQEPGLAAVRPLHHVPEARTFVLQFLDQDTLRGRLTRASRADPRGGDAGVDEVLRRVGRWIARFHALGPEVEARRSTPEEVAEVAQRFGAFLRPLDASLGVLADRVAGAVGALGSDVPIGYGHGDLAPRNVFVAADGSVTLIDPLGRWRVPIEEDLAAFLIDLRTAGAQTVLVGRAVSRSTLAAYEEAVLDGYASGSRAPIQRERLAIFTGLVLLDRWAATLTRPTPSARSRLVMSLVRRRLRAENQRVLASLPT